MSADYTYSSPDADTITTEIPDRMQQAKRWLLWKLEPNPTQGKKPRKVPYYTSGARRFGKLDSTEDTARLDTLTNALSAYAMGGYAGIGFALGPDGDGYWCGIDFDDFEAHPNLAVLTEQLPGYVERSPSGTGVHAIGYGPTIRSMGYNESGVEVYGAGRYFTVTGEAIGGDIEDISAFVAEHLVELHRAGMPTQHETAPAEAADTKTLRDLRSALASIRADARETWVRVGHALKTIGDQGRGLWIEWSQTSEKYDAQDAARVWESFQPSATDYRVVFAEAKRQGWVNTAGRQRSVKLAAVSGGDVVDMDHERQKRKPKDNPPPGPGAMPATHTQHFQVLGYDGDVFFFFSSGGKQIRALSSYKLGRKIELLTLAPLDWWEREYGGEDGFTARRVEMAANHLIRKCYAKGVFSPDSRRGRGVWVDTKDDQRRIVIHAGDRLYIDGNETPLLQGDTAHVYEQARAVSVSMDNPLSKAESKEFLMFCRSLSWECATYGYLLAGFIVVAIASGALRWRPHGLLNGPKGCGKSWVMDVLVHILGGFCLAATGGTSAAGLRQSLASDALPVLFDEAEGDSGRAQDNIAAVLSLMRHSSAALEAKVFKGGADGRASASIVRSCFLLAAIRDPLIQAADKSRVTLFNLRAASPESANHWKTKLVPMADRLMRNGYAERLRGRVFASIPTLLEAIDVFSNACTDRFGDRRMGDQIGAMLGGVWLLTEDGVPTEAEAARRVGMMKWEDQSELLRESSDERACLQAILEAHVRVDGDNWHGEASIGELVKFVRTKIPSADLPIGLPERDAKRTLAMYGIRVEESGNVLVSNTNGMLARKVMAHTHWPQGWGKLLSRITGAQKRANPVEISGTKSRVTEVPGSELDGNSGDTDEATK